MSTVAPTLSPWGPSRTGLRLRGAAVLVIAAVAVTGWLHWRPGPPDQVSFTVVTGVVGDGTAIGTPVRLRGTTIGEITDIAAAGVDRRTLTVRVGAARLAELSTTAQPQFVSANVFGSTALEFVPAPGGEPIVAGTVLEAGDRAADHTVTAIMRDAGRAVTGLLTVRLSDAVDDSAELLRAAQGLITSALIVLRTWQRTERRPVAELLPKLAGTAEGITAFGPAALGILHALAAVEELDDDARTRQASDTISEVSNLVFAFAGDLVGALGPMSQFVDMLLDLVIPLNQSMREVTPDQIRRLLTGVGGALHQRAGATELDTEILVRVPALRLPLQLTTGGVR
ncbi:Mce family protein [Nocardia rhamnosiphila]|uniref:Mce family protein n=1 Tax=Nocardia rhamnosiphila TaxID=426716 RepID=UPI00379FECAD